MFDNNHNYCLISIQCVRQGLRAFRGHGGLQGALGLPGGPARLGCWACLGLSTACLGLSTACPGPQGVCWTPSGRQMDAK